MSKIILNNDKNNPIGISLKTLQRHFACFGSSGSGKTVACKVLIEELAMRGIPIIAFDPQGDISSLAVLAEESDTNNQINNSKNYKNNVEVVVWTPSSSKGIPLSINPLQFSNIDNFAEEDKSRYFSEIAKNISCLIGYHLDSDSGKSCESVLSIIFEHLYKNNIILNDFIGLVDIINNIPVEISVIIKSISTNSLLKEISKKISLLTIGSRKLLFQSGVPANINSLLGLDSSNDKTRISIIYLNTLSSFEEKEFFIGSIAQLLYNWMLENPPNENFDSIQCAFFIDEIAPYIPPVKKSACKTSLELLFRQGRKYGVSSIIATQSPGDIDYKAIGQFSTFALGSLNTNQDIKKVKRRIESSAPTETESIIKQLPSLNPGEFLLISPDEYDSAQNINIRWLLSKHPLIISENKLGNLNSEKIRNYYLSKSKQFKKTLLDDSKNLNSAIKRVSKKNNSDNSLSLIVKNIIIERDLIKIIKPFLNGMIFKSETLYETKFNYYPLIQSDLVVLKNKGFFKKKIEEIPEKLYLDYKNYKLVYIKKNKFIFTNVIDIDPNKIIDLDNKCEIIEKDTNEVKFDKRILGNKKIDQNKIKNHMERKFRVKVKKSKLILLPYWECNIINQKTKENRYINIDGVFGSEIKFNE